MQFEFVSSSERFHIKLPYDRAIPLLGTDARGMKAYAHIKTCSPMLTAALFIIAKKGKSPNVCQLTNT